MRQPSQVHHTRIPLGCDYQGRYPQAAECCTEIGNEDEQCNSLMPLAIAAAAIVLLIAVGLAVS